MSAGQGAETYSVLVLWRCPEDGCMWSFKAAGSGRGKLREQDLNRTDWQHAVNAIGGHYAERHFGTAMPRSITLSDGE